MMEWNTNERREITAEVITCVYCGHEYPRGTPAHGADVLTEHIKICEKHPMRDLELQLVAANTDLKALKSENELLRHKAAGNDTTMLMAELAAAKAELAELKQKEEQFAEMKVKNAEYELVRIQQHKHIGRLDSQITGIFAKLREANERAEQAEAQCATMLDCFGNLINRIDNGEDCFEELEPPSGFLGKTIHPNSMEYVEACEVLDDVKTTAGSELLSRMRRMEKALEWINCLCHSHKQWLSVENFANSIRDKIAALEDKP